MPLWTRQRLACPASRLPQRAQLIESLLLLVPIELLALLVALLRFDRQRCDRARFEPLQRDRLSGFLAVAVGVVLDALKRRVDLGDQLALPFTGAQLDRAVGLGGGPIGKIGMIDVLFLQGLQGQPRLPQDLVLPRSNFARKYSRCRSFIKGSFSEGR